MAYLTNKIGVHNFVALLGNPILPQERVMLADRAGVDGTEVMLQGLKGEPFTLASQADCSSYANAWAVLKQYGALTAGDAVELVIGGVSSHSHGYAVKVLRVEAIRIAKISGAVGNLQGSNPTGWLEARWDLIAIPLSTEV